MSEKTPEGSGGGRILPMYRCDEQTAAKRGVFHSPRGAKGPPNHFKQDGKQ